MKNNLEQTIEAQSTFIAVLAALVEGPKTEDDIILWIHRTYPDSPFKRERIAEMIKDLSEIGLISGPRPKSNSYMLAMNGKSFSIDFTQL